MKNYLAAVGKSWCLLLTSIHSVRITIGEKSAPFIPYRFLIAYCSYLIGLLIFLHAHLGPLDEYLKLSKRLEVSTIVAHLVLTFMFVTCPDGLFSQPPGRLLKIILCCSMLGALGLLYGIYDEVHLASLGVSQGGTSELTFTLGVAVVSILVLVFDQGMLWKSTPVKPKEAAIVYGADWPLVLGIVVLLTVSIGPRHVEDLGSFIGGALAFKIGAYYGALCLIETFFPKESLPEANANENV